MDKRIMPKTQTGCIPFQHPKSIVDLDTGKVMDDSVIRKFLEVVLEEAKAFSEENKDVIEKILSNPDNRVSAPVGTAWKGGLKHDYSRLPSDYKQRSRISRVVLHRVMTDWEWAGCSSRWIHGKQQEWIIRLTRRVGSVHMFVNAAGTSKTCAKCGYDVSCDSKTRISRCTSEECGFSEDRDRMASWVIAKRGIDRFIKYFSKVVVNRD